MTRKRFNGSAAPQNKPVSYDYFKQESAPTVANATPIITDAKPTVTNAIPAVQQEIISIPYAEEPEGEAASTIPIWIKTTAEFWVNDKVSDDEFATALEWLINNGIIRV